MAESTTYSVPTIHCAHCAMSIREEVTEVEGVDDVAVDIETRLVTVSGAFDDAAVREAIREAGYEAA